MKIPSWYLQQYSSGKSYTLHLWTKLFCGCLSPPTIHSTNCYNNHDKRYNCEKYEEINRVASFWIMPIQQAQCIRRHAHGKCHHCEEKRRNEEERKTFKIILNKKQNRKRREHNKKRKAVVVIVRSRFIYRWQHGQLLNTYCTIPKHGYRQILRTDSWCCI